MKNIAVPTKSPSLLISRDRLATVIMCVLLAALVWIAFGQTIHHEFLNYDDNEYVYDNPGVKQGLSLQAIGWAFTHSYSANWHPLTTISHMLDVQLYGLNPWGHHLTNVLLHALAAILLFFALRQLTFAVWPSAFVAAIFAVHPLRVESVAWISERKDVLSGVFFMLTLLAYAHYVHGLDKDTHSRRRYLTVAILFALGLMSKPTLVTLPFVLLLLDYWPLQRMQKAKSEGQKQQRSAFQSFSVSVFREWSVVRGLVSEKIPLFVLSAASCAATVVAQGEALQLTKRLALVARAANALLSYAVYLGQLFYPARLAVMYPFPTDVGVVDQLLPAFLLLLTISILFFRWRTNHPFLLVGWLWYLGTLVPMIGIVQVGSQAHADRYTYVTQIGLYIIVAWSVYLILTNWRRGTQAFAVIAFLVISGLTAWSHHETSYWRTTETLWRRALSTTDNNFIAHNNLAHVLTLQGKFPEAIAHFRQAIQIRGDYADAYNNLGNALLDSDQTARSVKVRDGTAKPETSGGRAQVLEEAMADYKKAIQFKPNFAEAWTNLGTALREKGNLDAAAADYQKALEIAPDLPEANGNYGNALLEKGKTDEAMPYYEKAIELKPGYADAHYGLSQALLKQGKSSEAMEHLKQVLQLKPDYPEAHHNMGVILAQKGQLDSAVTEYEQAISLDPNYAQAENNLGNALLREGKIDGAITHLQKAITIEPNYAEPYNDLGSAFMQKGQVDDAITWYEKALKLKQDYAEAHSNLGNALFQKKDFDNSIAQYKAAIFLKPNSAPIQYNLGNALIAKGNRVEAIACYQSALRIEPGYAAAKQQLRKLGVALPQ